MKLRFFIIISSMILLAFSSKAENAISINNLEVKTGSTASLQVSVTNDFVCAGLQFYLSLPKGVTIDCNEEDWDTTDRTKKFNVAGNFSDGYYKFSILSLNGKNISGNEGAVLEINLKVSSDISTGDYEMKISNALLFEEGNPKDIYVPDFISTLTVSEEDSVDTIWADIIKADDEIYTLSGIKVTKVVTGGVYIINGQKVLVK